MSISSHWVVIPKRASFRHPQRPELNISWKDTNGFWKAGYFMLGGPFGTKEQAQKLLDQINARFPVMNDPRPGQEIMCCHCGKWIVTDRELVFCDLEGEPYKAYYHASCLGEKLS